MNFAQWATLYNLREILNPSNFRITTQTRANRFVVEHQFVVYALRQRDEVQNKIQAMQARLDHINTYVVQMLEIQQESNGNALIVFTLVTIIFLPLSWATSYLGMNTSDIRNSENGQWMFWIIALPVTSVVIGLSLLVVLKGEVLRELLIKARSKRLPTLTRKQGINRTPSRVFTNGSTMNMGTEEKKGWARFRKGRKHVTFHSKV